MADTAAKILVGLDATQWGSIPNSGDAPAKGGSVVSLPQHMTDPVCPPGSTPCPPQLPLILCN